jgi:2-methylcitrate dehydratase PrpD
VAETIQGHELSSLEEIVRWITTDRAPADVQSRARLMLLDTLGCALSGMRSPEVRRLQGVLEPLESGPVAWPGSSFSGSVSAAAYTFALGACFDEACEGSARAHGRPGVATIAAAWALGRARNATLSELLDAVVIGYELAARLGEVMRIRPGMHVDATFPSFGAAAAASWLLGNGPSGVMAAMQIAAAQLPASLYVTARQGANSRNTYLPHAATLGLQAACACAAGLQAPHGAIEEAQTVTLGHAGLPALAAAGEWLILQGYLKPWAGVRHLHYAAAAAQQLRGSVTDPGEIREIRLSIYPEALTYCGNRAPGTMLQAQFSLSWAVAAMLTTGDLGPDAFSAEALADPRIRRLESQVVLEREDTTGRASARTATLTITNTGKTARAQVDQVAGDPGAPLTSDDVTEKFLRFSAPSIGRERAQRLSDAVLAGDGRTALTGLW